MATYSRGMRVNRAISGADTVNANCYAEVTYEVSSFSSFLGSSVVSSTGAPATITVIFGPSQTIPASITKTAFVNYSSGSIVATATVTYSVFRGVEFINT